MVTYEQHKEFLEAVLAGAEVELMGFVDARDNPKAARMFEHASLSARYRQGYMDGKAMLEIQQVSS